THRFKRLKRRVPRFDHLGQRIPAFDGFTQTCRARNHVERVLIMDVFVRRLLPTKMLWIVRVSLAYNRHACRYRLELLTVCHMYLHPTATLTRMLLEGRLKITTAEIDAGQSMCVEGPGQLRSLYVRRADKFKRAGRAAPLRHLCPFQMHRPRKDCSRIRRRHVWRG